MWNLPACKNFLKRKRVWICVQTYGCEVERVQSSWCGVLSRKDSSVTQWRTDPTCVWTWQALRTDTCSSVVSPTISYLLPQSKTVITVNPPLFLFSSILCNTIFWMIYTLVITIGTFPYDLRVVTIAWSLDHDTKELQEHLNLNKTRPVWSQEYGALQDMQPPRHTTCTLPRKQSSVKDTKRHNPNGYARRHHNERMQEGPQWKEDGGGVELTTGGCDELLEDFSRHRASMTQDRYTMWVK
jgi:hypothetical protein